jgi:hypothetical protein
MLDRTETCNICRLAINLFRRQVFIGCKLSTVLELALHMCLCDLSGVLLTFILTVIISFSNVGSL